MFGSFQKSAVTTGRVALYRIPYWLAQEDAQFFGILQQPFLIPVSHHVNSRSIAGDHVHFIDVNIPWPRPACLSFDEFMEKLYRLDFINQGNLPGRMFLHSIALWILATFPEILLSLIKHERSTVSALQSPPTLSMRILPPKRVTPPS